MGRKEGEGEEEEEEEQGVKDRTPPENRHPQGEQQDFMKNME